MRLLDNGVIKKYLLAAGFALPYDLHVLTSVDSTNRYLKDSPVKNALAICCAEMQTAGRGRLGRSWHSPYGENIYLSLRFVSPLAFQQLTGLSLVMSLAVLAALEPFNQEASIGVKWPNDLLWQGKKLCGSLIEVQAEQVIIGIGLNVNTDTIQQELPDKPWCSLYEITGVLQDRNAVIADIILHCTDYWQRFIKQGFAAFREEWLLCDLLLKKQVSVRVDDQLISGEALGVDALGQLQIQDKDGFIHNLSFGEAAFLKEI